MTFKVAPQFEYLFDDAKRKRINIFYGGRGSGKTTNIAIFLLFNEFLKNGKNILVLRQFNTNNKDSVYSEFIELIHHAELNFLKITNNDNKAVNLLDCVRAEIINNKNKNRIVFYGLNDNNAASVKGYSKFDVFWIEEAHYLSKYAFNIIEPTPRLSSSYHILTFNPQNEDDYIYKLALSSDNNFIKSTFMNYSDNPFYSNSSLETSRLLHLKNVELGVDTIENYNHIWLGAPAPIGSDCIFNHDVFKKCILYDYDTSFKSYLQVILAIDPATTNKDFSNETGLILAGVTKDMIVHVISDFSGNMSPNELSKKVNEITKAVRVDSVVVETNNGGDFIKAVILNDNPTLTIHEVRAVKDKKDRASPVAVLMNLDKVLIYDGANKELFKQMRKLTTRGYIGAKGESPDRLDAMVWAVYHLLDLKDTDTRNTLFNTGLYKCSTKGYITNYGSAGIINNDIFVIISFEVLLDVNVKKLNFTRCEIYPTSDIKQILLEYDNKVFFKECEIAYSLGALTYSSNDNDLMQNAIKALAKINGNINLFNIRAHEYKNFYGNLLIKALDAFTQDTQEDIVVECFCDIVNLELWS